MVLKFDSFDKIREYVNKKETPVVIYGAWMIGQIIMTYIVVEYGIVDKLLFYVDGDSKKQNETIHIGNRNIEIKSLDVLPDIPKDAVILITTSNYTGVISMLNTIEELRENIVAIIPVILALNAEQMPDSSMITESKKFNIPKKINYCWFSGNPMPDYLNKCIESWKKFCPDYEIIRWDEDNYNVEKNLYMKQAYEAKKWGFVPDIARLDILYNYGGLYIDTDVEVIRNLDDLLKYEAFAGVEKWGNINMGGCSGAVPHHPVIKEMLDFRKNEPFVMQDGSFNLTTCGYYETMPLIKKGFKPNNTVQNIAGMTIFSSDYFHPYDYMSGETCITKNTYSIHHFNGGWLDEKHRKDREKTKKEYQCIINSIKSLSRNV